MHTTEIRQRFLAYFERQGHHVVASSSLIPHNDATLLFVNSGMVQFKDVFLGTDQRPYKRATTSQRSLRAGGKHNDLDNVGYTARHHTFFEMLGNFSFGDYFKREAISFAWNFLTVELKLPREKLWITVYEQDDEAADIWLKEMKVDPTRFSRIGAKDNFWSMGDTGPCGPCSEIFYDHGPEIWGGPPGSPDADGDRYIEIWNLVFMQFNRAANGDLTPLPKPSVDTGMGLERVAAVMQGVHDNYDIDLFQHLIRAAVTILNLKEATSKSLRVIADHIRACAFLVVDGIVPNNEGRGYVLRRIIRRAIRHGHQLGATEPFFYRLVPALVEAMGDAYPELKRAQTSVQDVLKQEEIQFAKTLNYGMKELEKHIVPGTKVISGEIAFLLYDTYGFPVDLTADIARERNMTVDMPGFEQALAVQQNRSRSASQFKVDYSHLASLDHRVDFCGYEHHSSSAKVLSLVNEHHQPVEQLLIGEKGGVILDRTPFYAESGGQVGDIGELISPQSLFKVENTQKQGEVIIHLGRVEEGELQAQQTVQANISTSARRKTAAHHSVTHLLHAALRQILGEHVVQKGSLVGPEYLRFDFAHTKPLTPQECVAIERLVNQVIRDNETVETKIMSPAEAKAEGAMALFGEKYGDRVRVLRMGDFSTELCGGTHVGRTGDIGVFKILSESGIAAGVRRIEAIAGEVALQYFQAQAQLITESADVLKTSPDALLPKVKELVAQGKALQNEVDQLKRQQALLEVDSLLASAQSLGSAKWIAKALQQSDAKSMREMMDILKTKLSPAVIVLACCTEGRVNLVVGVSDQLTSQVRAGDLINFVANQVGGKGGGRADMAQAGGTQPEHLPQALASVEGWLTERLK